MGPVQVLDLKFRTIQPEETIDLRHRVMWPDSPRDSVMLPDDAQAMHIGAFDGNRLIGVGSFFREDRAVRLRKLAVDFDLQGKGVASLLLDFAFNQLRSQGIETIWCDARVSAAAFYRQNGFQVETNIFQKQGLDYVIARQKL